MKYLKYLSYLLRHKYYVTIECFKIGLYWQGIVHDLSKLRPSEFFPYVNFFYSNEKEENDSRQNRYGKPDIEDIKFDTAWLKHIHRNPHHWQHWILQKDDGENKCLPMPNKYKKEMIADWRGAGKAQGHGNNIIEWYTENRLKMIFHPTTRMLIEEELKINIII